MEAFRNLVDPEEEEFLRASLPAQEFRRIKRERARTALVYVKELSKASLQFARFGDAAQRSPDPVIVSRKRLVQQLDVAQHPRHQQMLRQAIAEIEKQLSSFE